MAEVGGGVDLGDRREESQRARRQRRVRSGGSGGSGGGGSGGGGGGGGGGLGARLGRAVPRDARALQRVDDPASGATTGAGAGWGAGGGCGGSCGGARLRRPFGPLLPSPLGPGHGAWRRASARVWCRTYKCVGGCDAAPLRRGDGSPPPPPQFAAPRVGCGHAFTSTPLGCSKRASVVCGVRGGAAGGQPSETAHACMARAARRWADAV